MIARLFGLSFLLAAIACGSSTGEVQTAQTTQTPVRFRGPEPAPVLPHRTVQSDALYRALAAALPPKDAYDLAALSCAFVSFPPGSDSTTCTADGMRIEDATKARAIFNALQAAGAQVDLGGKEATSFDVRNVHSAHDAAAFDDAANVKWPPVPNTRLEGKEAQDVMNALAGGGVTEDDGTLFVICTKFGAAPTCGFQGRTAPGGTLDGARSLALWNAFVHDPSKNVLNASHFVWDGSALSFVAVLDTTSGPPSSP